MMKAGTYYIGDLCYVMHDRWDEFCSITCSEHNVLDGEFNLKDGTRFATLLPNMVTVFIGMNKEMSIL